MFVVVSYDITEDTRRNKIAKKLKDFGKRVQKSVFECNLDEDKIKELVKTVSPLLDEEEDSLRVYKLCRECKNKTQIYGFGELTEDVEVYIV